MGSVKYCANQSVEDPLNSAVKIAQLLPFLAVQKGHKLVGKKKRPKVKKWIPPQTLTVKLDGCSSFLKRTALVSMLLLVWGSQNRPEKI